MSMIPRATLEQLRDEMRAEEAEFKRLASEHAAYGGTLYVGNSAKHGLAKRHADRLDALLSSSSSSPGEIERIQGEHAEMQWGLENIHMLARRAMNAPNEAKCREKLPHILRLCEQQSPKPLGGSVLHGSPSSSARESLSYLPDSRLLELWRSVNGPHSLLNGPLIRYAGLVQDEIAASSGIAVPAAPKATKVEGGSLPK